MGIGVLGDLIIEVGDIVVIDDDDICAVVESVSNNYVYVRLKDGSRAFWVKKRNVRIKEVVSWFNPWSNFTRKLLRIENV